MPILQKSMQMQPDRIPSSRRNSINNSDNGKYERAARISGTFYSVLRSFFSLGRYTFTIHREPMRVTPRGMARSRVTLYRGAIERVNEQLIRRTILKADLKTDRPW